MDSKNRRNRGWESLRGRSKAQSCLHKILQIISDVPPPTIEPQPKESSRVINGEESRGFLDFDLNICAAPSPLTEEAESALESESSTHRSVVDADGGGCSGGGESNDGEKSEQVASTTTFEANGEFEETKGKEETGHEKFAAERSEKSLELLIEAVKVVSGDFKEEECESEVVLEGKKAVKTVKRTSRSGNSRRSKDEDMSRTKSIRKRQRADEDDDEESRKVAEEAVSAAGAAVCGGETEIKEDVAVAAPVVRSKRGRIRVLPHKYRDSILEPWTRLSPSTGS